MTSRSSQYGTEVSRLGTDRSSMETLFLTCLQANFIIGGVISHPELTVPEKNDIVWEEEGFYNSSIKYITYEEVININDATTSERSIQAEKSIGSTMGTGAS